MRPWIMRRFKGSVSISELPAKFVCVYILTFLSGDRTKAGEEGEVSTVGWGSGVYSCMHCIFMAIVRNINPILAIAKYFPHLWWSNSTHQDVLVEKKRRILLTWL